MSTQDGIEFQKTAKFGLFMPDVTCAEWGSLFQLNWTAIDGLFAMQAQQVAMLKQQVGALHERLGALERQIAGGRVVAP